MTKICGRRGHSRVPNWEIKGRANADSIFLLKCILHNNMKHFRANPSASGASDTESLHRSTLPAELCTAQDIQDLMARSFFWPGITRATVTCSTVINMKELGPHQIKKALWVYWPGEWAIPCEKEAGRCQSSILWVYIGLLQPSTFVQFYFFLNKH